MTYYGAAGGDGEFGEYIWGDESNQLAFFGRDVAFSATSDRYACPSSDVFTPAQAELMIERLVDRHNGTPYRPDDTATEYPYLSCGDLGSFDPSMYGLSLPAADVHSMATVPLNSASGYDTAEPPIYTLTGNQIMCGFNLCSDGSVVAVWVQVVGDSVNVSVCNGQDIDASNVASCLGMNGDTEWWTDWQGQRVGDKAVVAPTDNNPSPFFWGTVVFAGSGPDDTPVQFISADNCQRQDGTFGTATDTACA